MFLAVLYPVVLAVIVIAAVLIANHFSNLWGIPIGILAIIVILASVFLHWWYAPFMIVIALFTWFCTLLHGWFARAIVMFFAVVVILSAIMINISLLPPTTIDEIFVDYPNLPPLVAVPTLAPASYCDPSTVPFTDMGELHSGTGVITTIHGPAIYEWWTSGSNEGVQRVDAGHFVTIHDARGHFWTLPSQEGLDCAWNLHVANYAAKPQHAGKTIEQLIVPPPADLLK